MLLLITGSFDGTSDIVVPELEPAVFRFNYDLFAEYELKFTPEQWSIRNPSGLEITSKTVSACFWWKAFNSFLVDHDQFITEEVKYIFREIYNSCREMGIVRGVRPDFHNQYGKMTLLNIARQYFNTPDTLATFRLAGTEKFAGQPVVAKSFSSGLTTTNKALFTTQVEVEQLHPSYPWFLQEKLDSDADVTVFVCGQEQFAFYRDRANLKSLDWRTEINTDSVPKKEWFPLELTQSDSEGIKGFCSKLRVDWGRIDFMRTADGLVFLEYNANGQWVFLDFANEYGLLESVRHYLSA